MDKGTNCSGACEGLNPEAASVRANYLRIRDSICEEERRAGIPDGSVRLIGVTKFMSAQRIVPALEAGLDEIGENRAQELMDKFELFSSYNVKKHFIGTLQTNKVKYLIGRAELIQSVDREALAVEINRLAAKAGLVQDILIEVNIGLEAQKSGIAPDALWSLLDSVSNMQNVRVKGLMCIPPAGGETATRRYFASMRKLFERIKALGIPNVCMDELSMGMSSDYRAAIAEGATMVRVGSAIFGARKQTLPFA